MKNNKHKDNGDEATHARSLVVYAFVIGVAMPPVARAQDYYLARAIGDPVPIPAKRESVPPRDTSPDLPGLGTDQPRAVEPPPNANDSTWKWVVGIAVTAAVIALAKGGDSGGGGTAPSADSGGNSGTGGGSGGGSAGGGGGGGGPSLPRLPRVGDDD